MEKCELEITEETQITMEGDEGSVQKLGNHLGKLLIFLEFTGIPIRESRNGCTRGYLWDLFKKLCYPIFIHFSLLFLVYVTLRREGLTYVAFIDTVLPILPCLMWLIMRLQTTSLKQFLADLSKITNRNFMSQNRCLLYCTNAGICFIFAYPLLLFGMRLIQGNVINTFEAFRILHEAIFPGTMLVLYISISYLLLQKLRFFKTMFQKRLDLTCSADVENIMKDYLHVVKSVDSFENLLCNMALVLVLLDFFMVLLLVMDMILLENWLVLHSYEAVTEIVFVFISLGIMSFCAGNISLELAAVKSVLMEKMFTQVDQDCSKNNEKRINLLLKKDICILTLGKCLVFDRGFLLKGLVFTFAEVVFISEVHSLLKY